MHEFSFQSFLTGFPVGIAFCLTLGPVFFSLLKNSLLHGWKAAVLMALGVTLSDFALLVGAFSGVQVLLSEDSKLENIVQIAGGLLLIGLGISAFLKKTTPTEGGVIIEKQKNSIHFILTGFFLNILNPLNFAEWVGTASYLKTVENYTMMQSISFFSGALLGVGFIETSIGLSASRLRPYLSPKIIHGFNVATGVLFLISGIILFAKAFL